MSLPPTPPSGQTHSSWRAGHSGFRRSPKAINWNNLEMRQRLQPLDSRFRGNDGENAFALTPPCCHCEERQRRGNLGAPTSLILSPSKDHPNPMSLPAQRGNLASAATNAVASLFLTAAFRLSKYPGNALRCFILPVGACQISAVAPQTQTQAAPARHSPSPGRPALPAQRRGDTHAPAAGRGR